MAVKPLLLDQTGQQILGALERQNAILAGWSSKKDVAVSSMAEVGAIVRSRNADKVFSIGDKITVPYHFNGSTYDFVWNAFHFADVTLGNGEVVPGMYLQAHYNTIESLSFDESEAFYCNETGSNLPAGTYNITYPTKWNSAQAGSYQFTLPVALPPNGKLKAFKRSSDDGMTYDKLSMYQADGKTLVSGGTNISVTQGNGGTNLGVLANTTGGTLNPMHYVGYGNNSYPLSAIRQWLNSSADVGQWWQLQHKYDIAPSQLSTYKGFKAGFEDDFLQQLKPVLVKTVKNTGIEDGAMVSTFDTFFLPCLSEMYITPQANESFDSIYWSRILNGEMCEYWNTYPELKGFDLNNHTSSSTNWLRSAYRAYGCSSWFVDSTGRVSATYPYSAYRSRPLCVIC